ncbi:pheromone-processing carboxypeptidase KEX1-like [Brassica rapa]|uniref:pheromone-processing carboxypeptidase KEX1-like n=1 Tax=Brassica campestris TaxID=3711 RepID=UPI00142D69DD|nr:pheromone-processing carboxypeptidase KEX1-like [Brassica rapa]
MDPSHQRVEQSQVTLPRDDDNEGTESPDVIVGNCDMVVELGLGCGTVFIENIDSDVDDVNNLNDFDEPDDDDLEVHGITSMGSEIRLITIESGSDDDDDHENEREVWGIDLNDDDDVNDDDDDDDDVNVTIPLCWDSLQVEDRGVAAEEFHWEEVYGGGGLVDESEKSDGGRR